MYMFLALAMSITSCKDSNIEIAGKIKNPGTGKYIFLEELQSERLVAVDSVILDADGSYTFEREISYPSFYLLKTSMSSFLTMLLEPGQELIVDAYFDSLNYPTRFSGSEGTRLLIEYNRELQQTIRKLSGLSAIYRQNIDSPDLMRVIERIDSLARDYLTGINTYTKKFIDDNLSSLVSLVALYQQVAPREYVLNPEKDLEYYMKVDSSLSSLYPDYEPVRSLHAEVRDLVAKINARNKSSLVYVKGSEAPEIALPTPRGDTVKLSSTRGKIVLLDFWASWCNPCRLENPNLLKAYNLYHSRGFQIYQVSLDKTREAWIKGIEEDHLDNWIHVSDLNYWNSVVVPLYGIESIPTNYLLDRDGRILEANLRDDMLQTRLAELFKR
jgi:thiol-disulfide isomerase/thioredoxin